MALKLDRLTFQRIKITCIVDLRLPNIWKSPGWNMKVSKSLVPSGIKRLVSNSVLIGWDKRRSAKVLLFQIDRERLVLARAVVIAAESVVAFFALTGEVTPAHVVALMRAK